MLSVFFFLVRTSVCLIRVLTCQWKGRGKGQPDLTQTRYVTLQSPPTPPGVPDGPPSSMEGDEGTGTGTWGQRGGRAVRALAVLSVPSCDRTGGQDLLAVLSSQGLLHLYSRSLGILVPYPTLPYPIST